GRDIETNASVQSGFRTFIAKYILPIISAEGSCVFPLRINRSIPLANRNPSILAGGNAGALIRFFEPWNDAGRLLSMASAGLVVVWEGAVKRVLSRRELPRNVFGAPQRFCTVNPAITSAPIFVP